MQKNNAQISEDEQIFNEKLASLVLDELDRRRRARRPVELQWELNLDFLRGKQYVGVSSVGDVREEDVGYLWQSKNVFNHILPVIDTRLSKLARIRPLMTVRPASEDEADIYTARLTSKVLNSTCARLDDDALISSATRWSEVTGTAFYYVGWDGEGGKFLGENDGTPVSEGDVTVSVISPFEIFPDDLTHEAVEECDSIIRARVVSVDAIKQAFDVDVAPEKDVFTMSGEGEKQLADNSVTLIELYEKPCAKYPLGRVVTVAGGKVLAVSDFPFENGTDGRRTYPFIKQVSHVMPGCFFGSGIIERLIPVQRAYNAVRNRKHEFLSRIAMGVLTVEDGSCDVDELIEEGLPPGKVLVYRQGSQPPRMMNAENIPSDFDSEEEKLLEEFVLLSGVNEVSQNYKATLGVTSAAGLKLLLEQDDERLTVSAENVRRAVKQLAKHIIRLFKQFATVPRLMRLAGDSSTAEVFYFTSKDITSDDVVFETENDLSYSPSQRRSNVLEIIESGILSDENGQINQSTKVKLLELMGFGGLETVRSAEAMHASRAGEENVSASEDEPICEEYDDHQIHILEHTRFLVGREYLNFPKSDKIKEVISSHLMAHKALAKQQQSEQKPPISHKNQAL